MPQNLLEKLTQIIANVSVLEYNFEDTHSGLLKPLIHKKLLRGAIFLFEPIGIDPALCR